jgi:orotate phosphoribosyltransferase
MQAYQREFLDLALAQGALRFGEFTLKSGRVSPYFFNVGAFHSGDALEKLGRAYARTILAASITFDLLFGPAYKGIPLVATTAIALAREGGRDFPWAFNRKEAKDHGEGGQIVGAPLSGRVLIIDDVITAGTAIRESMQIIRSAGAEAAGVVISVDRQERGEGERSAVAETVERYRIPVVAIVDLDDLIDYLAAIPQLQAARAPMAAYRARYGV